MEYQWKGDGPKPKVAANIFAATLERLAEGSDFGSVAPRAIVEEARPRSSPIHKLFLWNDESAAELYRIDLARKFVNRLQIVRVTIKDQPVVGDKAFYHVQTPDRRHGYVSRDRILSSRDLSRQVIMSAKRDLENFVTKYASTLSLSRAQPHLNEAIDAMRDEIDALATEATRRTDPATAKPAAVLAGAAT